MEWSTSKQSGDFVIAVIGDTPITSHLKSMAAVKKVGVQNIVIKKYSSASAVAKGEQYKALVVTENSGNARKGAGMSFVTVGGKEKFEVNESSISKNGIKVSTKLVQMGIKVLVDWLLVVTKRKSF